MLMPSKHKLTQIITDQNRKLIIWYTHPLTLSFKLIILNRLLKHMHTQFNNKCKQPQKTDVVEKRTQNAVCTASVTKLTYLRLAVLDKGSKHSSRERILWEKNFSSGSIRRATVCAYSRTPNVQMWSSYNADTCSRNLRVKGRNFVWYHEACGPCPIWKWYTSCTQKHMTLHRDKVMSLATGYNH